MTVDGGVNVTLHAETNIGPYTTTTKYNLNVYGDTNVGGTNPVYTTAMSSKSNVFVEGSIAAFQLIMADTSLNPTEFINLNTSETTTGDDAEMSIVFNKYVENSGGTAESYNLMTISTGIGANNELDTEVTVDGANAYLVVQSDFGGAASLTLQEMVSPGGGGTVGGGDDTAVKSKVTFENADGELLVKGTTEMPMLMVQDNRTISTSTAASDLVLQAYFDVTPLTSVGVTGVGASYINATAPDYRSIYGDQTAEFLASIGIVKAALTLQHSLETELMISTQAAQYYDEIVFANGTSEFMVVQWDDIVLQPQDFEGTVFVGSYFSGSGVTESYAGANLAVAALNIQQLTLATSTHVGYTNTSQLPMAVMEINTYSNSTSSASNSYNYPLYIASYEHIKLQTPYILIGESDPADSPDIQMDPYNGALKLNRTGIQQTTVDEELVLYSTHGSDLTAGVALEGAYRLTVNNITIEDKG